jgi:hypothetical protein
VQQVSEQPPNVSSDDEYAFSVNQINSVTENIVVNVGNVDLKMRNISCTSFHASDILDQFSNDLQSHNYNKSMLV